MNIKKTSHESGFTVVELLVSSALFALFASATATSFIGNIRYNYEASVKSEAIQLAQQILDSYRSLNPSTIPISGTTTISTPIGLRTYTNLVTFCPSGTVYCSGSTLRHLKVSVSLKNRVRYEVETIYSQLK